MILRKTPLKVYSNHKINSDQNVLFVYEVLLSRSHDNLDEIYYLLMKDNKLQLTTTTGIEYIDLSLSFILSSVFPSKCLGSVALTMVFNGKL